jgi:hypothetical protein
MPRERVKGSPITAAESRPGGKSEDTLLVIDVLGGYRHDHCIPYGLSRYDRRMLAAMRSQYKEQSRQRQGARPAVRGSCQGTQAAALWKE